MISGIVAECALQVRFVVDLKQRIHAGRPGRVLQHPDLVIVESPDDDEHGARARLARLKHLDRMHHEVLAQAGQRPGGEGQTRRHLAEVIQRSAEIVRIGQHGERIGPGGLIAPRLLKRGDPGS